METLSYNQLKKDTMDEAWLAQDTNVLQMHTKR